MLFKVLLSGVGNLLRLPGSSSFSRTVTVTYESLAE